MTLRGIKDHSPGILGVKVAPFVGITFVPIVSGSLSFFEDIDSTWLSSRVGSGVSAGGTTINWFRSGLSLWDGVRDSIAGTLGGSD